MQQQLTDNGTTPHLLGSRIATAQPQWQAVSKHEALVWGFCQGNMNYAAAQPLVPVSVPELAEAALELPLAFARHNGVLELVALCGLEPGVSYAVNSKGHWQFPYVPAAVNAHPFALSEQLQPDQPVLDRLWLDKRSTWLIENGGSPVFLNSGEPSPVLAVKLQLLQQKIPDSARDGPALNVLSEFNLLVPWSGLEALGVMYVDFTKLAKLTPQELARLNDLGGLWVAYAHRLSLSRLPRLMDLKRRAEEEAKNAVSLDDLLSGYQDGTLHFS